MEVPTSPPTLAQVRAAFAAPIAADTAIWLCNAGAAGASWPELSLAAAAGLSGFRSACRRRRHKHGRDTWFAGHRPRAGRVRRGCRVARAWNLVVRPLAAAPLDTGIPRRTHPGADRFEPPVRCPRRDCRPGGFGAAVCARG